MLWRLSLRNLQRRPWQTGLTLMVVATCTASLVACLLLVKGIEVGTRGAVDNLGADILVLPPGVEYDPDQVLFTGIPVNVYMPAQMLEKVKSVAGVAEATAQFFSQTLNQSCCSLPEEYRLVGYDPQTDFVVKRLLDKSVGRDLNPNEVIVGGEVPAFLGDRVLILGHPYEVAGYLRPLGGGVDKTIFIHISNARQISAESPYLQHLWKEAGDPAHLVSAILVRVQEGAAPEVVARSINSLGGVRAVTAGKLFLDLKKQLLVLVGVSWLLVVALGGVIVASLLSRYTSLVIERQGEIGLLRALGARKGHIFSMVMLETLWTGLGAGLLGLLGGWGITLILKGLVQKSGSFPFLLPPTAEVALLLGGILLVILILSALAAAWPARTCSCLDPVTALTEGELK
ncbi:ABC transporter permease [Thermanaeromonas sp. C210]|uniref:ABC transporter permease n=1 Tax=Thermanaeromonas sp. C210 TaxID=2731925 RepID=UPI00155C261D|nr:ABC transporter permease [Thermanaeromonas sp. C210]GFN22843.1 ABC transporter permease [Thermanaeromonas sp. C210]